jgi:hypothetical protein
MQRSDHHSLTFMQAKLWQHDLPIALGHKSKGMPPQRTLG